MLVSEKILRFSFLFVLAMAIFTSCSKDDEIDKDIKTTNTTTTTTTNSGGVDKNATQRVMNTDEDSLCFTFVYPLTIDLPDNGFVLVRNVEALFAFIEQWENDNPNADEYPSLRFPIDVVVDGSSTSVNSEEALEELVEYCFEEWEDDEDNEMEEFCFDFVYPITIVFPGGNSQTANDFETLFTAINDWYEANEDSDEDVTLAYPVEIIMDGTVITINSDEELEDAFEACEYAFDECFTINYPITIRIDSTDHAVNNTQELAQLIEDYYENNPDGDDPEIVFPISVTMNDGEVVTINNEEELDAIFEECFDEGCRATNLILASPKNAAEQVTAGMRFFSN